MKHEPAIIRSRDPSPVVEAIAKARIDYAADHGVSHAVVSMWLKTWGDADYKPFDQWLSEWDG